MTKVSEDRLRQIWDSVSPLEGKGLSSADAVLSKGLSKERAIRRRTVSILSSAAVVAAVFAGIFIGANRQESILLLADAEKTQFSLPDGSSVWLNRNSRLEYAPGFGSSTRTVKLSGEAYFDVVKDAEHPFVVETGDMDITVLGTKFTVSAYKDALPAAWLEEGSIEVNGKGLATTQLHPDQGIAFDGSTWTVSDTDAKCHSLWISDKLVMENMPLDEVVSSLEHWFGVRLAISDTLEAHDIKLSMTVRGESVDTILATINLLSGETVSIR